MNHLGEAGYIRLAEKTMTAKAFIEDKMRQLGYSVWQTDLIILVAGHDQIDIKKVVSGMTGKGWYMMGTPFPPLLQFTMDAVDLDLCEKFCADLANVTTAVESGEILKDGALTYT